MFVVISQDNCVWCEKAKGLLAEHGFDFEVVTVDDTIKTLFKNLNVNTVPQVIARSPRGCPVWVGGYQDLEEYLSE